MKMGFLSPSVVLEVLRSARIIGSHDTPFQGLGFLALLWFELSPSFAPQVMAVSKSSSLFTQTISSVFLGAVFYLGTYPPSFICLFPVATDVLTLLASLYMSLISAYHGLNKV